MKSQIRSNSYVIPQGSQSRTHQSSELEDPSYCNPAPRPLKGVITPEMQHSLVNLPVLRRVLISLKEAV